MNIRKVEQFTDFIQHKYNINLNKHSSTGYTFEQMSNLIKDCKEWNYSDAKTYIFFSPNKEIGFLFNKHWNAMLVHTEENNIDFILRRANHYEVDWTCTLQSEHLTDQEVINQFIQLKSS